ncbi:MAG: amidohydrolase family protein [Propionibacteriaceae bacterium]|nr:amidohydrolase family protein [Propionibacteriaceae bacterium]
MSIDLNTITAIDTHVHVEVDDNGNTNLPQSFRDAAAKYFKGELPAPTIDEIAERYRALQIAAVVFTVDAETKLQHPAISNDVVIAGAARHPDIMIPFASVDPHRGAKGVEELRRLVETYGIRGVKFHPSMQEFQPNDGLADGLYEVMNEHHMIGVFHTGQTGIGAGMPGGAGIKLRYSDPIYLDDVAADYPDITVIMAHPSVPWQDTAISSATHKPNVLIDLSGWSPKYFPPQLLRAINGPLRHKVLFASDYPMIDPERWLADFDGLELKDGVRDLVMKTNAARVLGLS